MSFHICQFQKRIECLEKVSRYALNLNINIIQQNIDVLESYKKLLFFAMNSQ